MRKFPNNYIRPKGRDISEYCLILIMNPDILKAHWRQNSIRKKIHIIKQIILKQ